MTTRKRNREMAEAIERAEEEEALEESRSYVRPRPAKEPSQVYSLRIPVGCLTQLKTYAAENGVTPSEVVRKLIVDNLEYGKSLTPLDGKARAEQLLIDAEQGVAKARKVLAEVDAHENRQPEAP
jgi:hypothetical protein